MTNPEMALLRKGYLNRIAVVGDSTASSTGTPFIPLLKRCLAALGYDADFIGAQNPTVTALSNVVGRDDERSAYGGQAPQAVAASLTNDLPAVIAANGAPDVVIVAGNYNGTGTLEAQTANWVTLYNTIRQLCTVSSANAIPSRPWIVSLGRALQNGAFDGPQETNNQAQYLAHHSIRTTLMAGGQDPRMIMAPLYTYSSWPPDDRQTTDNTHPADQMAAYQAITAASALTGVAAKEIEELVEGPVGLINGPGGTGALWCVASQTGTASIEIAAYDRYGRLGGRGTGNANTTGTFTLTGINTTGNTIKALMQAAGFFEASMVRYRLLAVAGQAIIAWPGGAVDGSAIQVAAPNPAPDKYAVGDYRGHTAAAQRPEVWFG